MLDTNTLSYLISGRSDLVRMQYARCERQDQVVLSVLTEAKYDLAKAGKTLATMDLLIAAHAIAENATLTTHDQAFRFAAALLHTEDWATDLQ